MIEYQDTHLIEIRLERLVFGLFSLDSQGTCLLGTLGFRGVLLLQKSEITCYNDNR